MLRIRGQKHLRENADKISYGLNYGLNMAESEALEEKSKKTKQDHRKDITFVR